MAGPRPSCVINIAELPGEKRPRQTTAAGIAAVVQHPSDATGLKQMGVHVRTVQPGFAGTHRHFHTVEEEWAFVLAGRATVRIGPLRLPVKVGDYVGFPPGPRPHHFLAEGDEPLVLLEGGERRPTEDGGWYPDARQMGRAGVIVQPYEEPPPEVGEEGQLVHVDDIAPKLVVHDVDPRARKWLRSLHDGTGLRRQAVRWAKVEAGNRSTALHAHDRTDEWVLILSGRGVARVGDSRCEIGPNDFLGHPASGPPHRMEALEDLTYLVGGQIDAADVVIYPDAGVYRQAGVLHPQSSR